jgi:5-methylcytosine-specific restriction endonuclease McrA
MAVNGKIYGAKVKIDLNLCYYCDTNIDEFNRTVDHLIPESRGGIRANKNKVPSCGGCNKLKGDMTPEEFARALTAMLRMEYKDHKKKTSYLKKVAKKVGLLIESKNNGKAGSGNEDN